MNDLLFIRHAETDIAGTFCGQSDPPINAAGRIQIAKLLQELHGETISAVYTSDLQRAVATGAAIAERFGVACVRRSGLREIDFGGWEGMTWDEIEASDPVYAQQWLDAFPSVPAPQGESVEAFEARVSAEVVHLQQPCDAGTLVVVTHAGVMRAVLRNVCGVGDDVAWQMTEEYCCVFRCDSVGRFLGEAVP